MQRKNNRKYKDSVFVDLFSKDTTAKENFLSLYNALHGTNLKPETTELTPLYLEQVLYKSFYNDVSFLVDNKIIILVEHQSTINENMPLRFLEYIARIYELVVNSNKKFAKKLQHIPKPEFYVFYNGIEKYPYKTTLRLSDAFLDKKNEHDIQLELFVTVLNINHIEYKQLPVQCKTLEEYSIFVELVRRFEREEKQTGFNKAIQYCIEHGILNEYLKRKSTEVYNMLMTEYCYETDVAVQREEAYEDGISQGIHQAKIETARNLLQIGMEPTKIVQVTGLTPEEISAL